MIDEEPKSVRKSQGVSLSTTQSLDVGYLVSGCHVDKVQLLRMETHNVDHLAARPV